MESANSLADNSESQDGEEKFGDEEDNNSTYQNQSNVAASGYYDAEKCRAYIASQSRVSKIDRFALQINRAIEVEVDVHSRLSKILNLYVKSSAQVIHDFTIKCSLGSQSYRQDKILNQKKKAVNKQLSTTQATISNDLIYGEGAHLVQQLLDQSITLVPIKLVKRRKNSQFDSELEPSKCRESFEPGILVRKFEDMILENLRKSEAIMDKLELLQQSIKNLASEHRRKVDFVHAAEEERQANTVIRRSAYNLSKTAIKAASTPIGPS